MPKATEEVKTLVEVFFKYPPLKSLLSKKPKERLKLIDKKFEAKFKKLISTGLTTDYETMLMGKRIIGVKTEIPLSSIEQISILPYIKSIRTKAEKKASETPQPSERFFCLRIILTMAYEGVIKEIEERYMLIKAASFEAAEEKVLNNKEYHESFYLNEKGETVEIRILEIDNYYEADAIDIEDFNNPNGVEVFFEWKKWKGKKKRSKK